MNYLQYRSLGCLLTVILFIPMLSHTYSAQNVKFIVSNKWARRVVMGLAVCGGVGLKQMYRHHEQGRQQQEFIQHLSQGNFDFLIKNIEKFSKLPLAMRQSVIQSYKEYIVHSEESPSDKVVRCTRNIDQVVRCHNKVEENIWADGISARREIKTSLDQIRDEIGKSLPHSPSLDGKQSAGPSRWGLMK